MNSQILNASSGIYFVVTRNQSKTLEYSFVSKMASHVLIFLLPSLPTVGQYWELGERASAQLASKITLYSTHCLHAQPSWGRGKRPCNVTLWCQKDQGCYGNHEDMFSHTPLSLRQFGGWFKAGAKFRTSSLLFNSKSAGSQPEKLVPEWHQQFAELKQRAAYIGGWAYNKPARPQGQEMDSKQQWSVEETDCLLAK